MARSGMIVTVSTLLVILLWAGAYAQPQAPTVRGFHDISDQEKAARAAVAPTEVAEWAKRHVSNFVNIASGSPQVLLSRTVRASELPTLGLPFGNVNVVDGAPPLVLVVLRGDFRSDGQLFAGGNAPPAAQVAQVKYVASSMISGRVCRPACTYLRTAGCCAEYSTIPPCLMIPR